jgi:hypothetical protein
MNDKYVVTGYHTGGESRTCGFVCAANGTITSFDPAGTADTSASRIDDECEAAGCNGSATDKGTITGCCMVSHRGFLRIAQGAPIAFSRLQQAE